VDAAGLCAVGPRERCCSNPIPAISQRSQPLLFHCRGPVEKDGERCDRRFIHLRGNQEFLSVGTHVVGVDILRGNRLPAVGLKQGHWRARRKSSRRLKPGLPSSLNSVTGRTTPCRPWRQRGSRPPPLDTCHFPLPAGKGSHINFHAA